MIDREPFIVHCAKCQHEWAPCFMPIIVSVLAKVATRSCPKCGHRSQLIGEVPRPTPTGDVERWLHNGDTGTSSRTIYAVMTGRTYVLSDGGPSVPYDPSDFGRCYRLLKVRPDWRERLHEMAVAYPAWSALVEKWDELTALYESELPAGRAPKCYAMIQKCIGTDH